ncbi:ABC transporter permease [Alkalihalobacillus sp. TS-13]|uniref:ABC transporter permease n=1 Tax=Alkalihalobacillus sp. TS-13 TaxID=2842455 RepID=UPI001C866FF4|nr:ABC transporter permease [Alkalihalobacillus sp. TS-13]
MNVKTLWRERANNFWSMAVRYLRYIGNSGFLFSVYVGVILGSYYYGQVLKVLPESFPAAEFLTILVFLIVSRGKIRTFLKTADANFLLPVEGRFRPYLQKSLLYSFVMQAFNVLVLLLILGPLYFNRITSERAVYFGSLVLILLLTGWNIISKWEELRVPDGTKRKVLPIIRLLSVLFTLYAIFREAWLITAVLIIGMAILYVAVYRPLSQKHTLKWERLIELEANALMLFYRIANMFVDVPEISRKVRKRSWAAPLMKVLSGKGETVFGYMYTRAFIRSNDYFGIYARLTVIGIILMLIMPPGFLLWGVSLLLIYMTAIQLTTLWPHFDMKVWVDLYPVSKKERYETFQRLIFRIMISQVVLFALSSFINHLSVVETGIILITGGALVLAFTRVLLFKQLEKRFIITEMGR